MPPAVEFAAVSKSYGALRALDDVSFSVQRGEMFGVIGPDGAGKTTAIRVACGLLRPSAGNVKVMGHDPVREHRQITGAVGYLSQRFSLYGDLTIDENIGFFAELHGVRRYEAARDRLLDMTQLTPFRARRADRRSCHRPAHRRNRLCPGAGPPHRGGRAWLHDHAALVRIAKPGRRWCQPRRGAPRRAPPLPARAVAAARA